MRIGFDAKRAFLNNTGLGNYSRDTIRILAHFYEDNKYFLYTPKEKEIRDNVEANLKEINNQYLVATKEIAKATNSGYAAFCSGLDQDVIERLKELDPFSISHISRYLISGYKSRLPRTIVDEILKNGHKHAGIESSVLCCLGRG